MNISNYLSAALLNHSLGVAPYTMPTAVYAALYTAPPSAAGGGTEVPAADYVRVVTTWSPAAVNSIATNAAVNFPANGVTLSNWGTVTAMGIFDAPTNGNMLFFGNLSAGVDLSLGTNFTLAATDLIISLS